MSFIQINDISGGIAPNPNLALDNQYTMGLSIDPDFPTTDSLIKPHGFLRPVGYAKFSGTEFTGHPLWIITNPKTNDTYVYASDGKVHSFNSGLTMRTADDATVPASLPISIASSGGNGAAYYNNYIYFATNTDIARYGPLFTNTGAKTSVAMTTGVWTGATLGTQTALTNTTYPTVRSLLYPNHPMHLHVDNKLYVGDFIPYGTVAATAGKGFIHFIQTKQVTNEGDTNDGSTYNALDLPNGYAPYDIESYGNNLVIAASQTTDPTINQGKSALFFWDTVSDSFYRQVPLYDPNVTALLNLNGNLYVFSGSLNDGMRVSIYDGGFGFRQIAYLSEGVSPAAGCIDALGTRLVWGSYITYPENAVCAYAYGTKMSPDIGGLHNIMKASAAVTASAGIMTALKYVQQASFISPRIIAGWLSSTPDRGLDKLDEPSVCVFRSKRYNFPRGAIIRSLRLNLSVAPGAGHTIVPKIFYDDEVSSTTLTTINSTNFASKRSAIYRGINLTIDHNFLLELRWNGSQEISITPPIVIEYDLLPEP